MKYRIALALFFLIQLVTSQKLVLVGGALKDDNMEIYQTFIEMSTVNEISYIGIITAASDDESAEENGHFYENIIKKYGATQTEWIPLHLANPNVAFSDEWVQKVQKMTGIFLGGGDQLRLVQLLFQSEGSERKDTPLLQAIRNNVRLNKTALAGTSAGTAAQQSTPMVTGGESYYSLKYKTQQTIDSTGDRVSYDINGGLGFLPFQLYLDTHFSVRGRDGRMISLIHDLQQLTGASFGAGIDENTALVVNGNHGQVLGTQAVTFFDLSQASGARDENGYLNIKNVRVHLLTREDEINLQTFKIIRYACSKTNLKGHEKHSEPLSPTYDIFSSPDSPESNRKNPDQFKIIVQDLFDSRKYPNTWGFTFETNPEFKVEMNKNQSSSEAYYDIIYPQTISFYNLRVDITTTNKSFNDEFLSLLWLRNKIYGGIEIVKQIFNQDQ